MSNDKTMQALVIEEFGRVAMGQMPYPVLRDDSLTIKVHYSGVSIGTEMLQGTGKHGTLKPPFIPGYQAAGEVVEVGSAIAGYQKGDAVAIFCRGSHAAYASTTAQLTHKIRSLDDAYLASLFVQPSVGANALNLASINSGDTVLVIGQGLIGQATAQLARMRGAYVAVADMSAARLALSRAHCADWVLDAADGPLAQQTVSRFPNGFDVVIESTGQASVMEDALRCVTYGGRFVFLAYHPGNLPLPFDIAHRREIRALFPFFIGKPPVRDGVLRLLESGSFPLGPLISHQVLAAEAAPLYQQLFTPARNDLNAIVIDWRGSR